MHFLQVGSVLLLSPEQRWAKVLVWADVRPEWDVLAMICSVLSTIFGVVRLNERQKP